MDMSILRKTVISSTGVLIIRDLKQFFFINYLSAITVVSPSIISLEFSSASTTPARVIILQHLIFVTLNLPSFPTNPDPDVLSRAAAPATT